MRKPDERSIHGARRPAYIRIAVRRAEECVLLVEAVREVLADE